MNTPSLPFNREDLILCCYGDRYAVGGPAEIVAQLANTIANYDCSQPVVIPLAPVAPEFEDDPGDTTPNYSIANRRHPEVQKTHETFGYLVVTEELLTEAFYHLRHNAIQRHGDRAQIRRAVLLARRLAKIDFRALNRENFLGWNVGRNSFLADLDAVSVTTADPENDWQAGEFARGAEKAGRDTLHASTARD